MHVLISGASIAGPITAYWLRRAGHQVTVVERTASLRTGDGGQAVDLLGPAVDVIERMGLLGTVEAARTRTEKMSLIRPGRPTVTIDAGSLLAGVSDRHVEIYRGDLAQILHAATADDVDYRFGTSIAAIDDGDVTFADGTQERFDLVIGADGQHSGVRRLAFGDESRYRHHLGGYLAVYSVPNYLGIAGTVPAYNVVDRAIALYPTRRAEVVRAVFLLRSEDLGHDHRDPADQRARLRSMVAGLGWEVPTLLSYLDGAEDFYFDSISQIRLDSWSRGRVTLVGDAGYGPGPAVGGGTSLATVGAYVLATELAADPANFQRAYEAAMAEPVAQSRRIGPSVLATLVPRSATQLWVMAQALRLLPRLPRAVQQRVTSFGGGPAAMLDGVRLRDVPPAAADLVPNDEVAERAGGGSSS